MAELTFSQAALVAAVPALISMASTYYAIQAEQVASTVKETETIKRARLTERDLIIHAAGELGLPAYSIPIADNRAWSNYYFCRTEGETRFNCSRKQKQVIPSETPKIIAKALEGGY
jgi:hypothetical protein